jgi:hypothetical protein
MANPGPHVYDFAAPVAASVTRHWSRWVEYDDVLQEIVLYYLRNKRTLDPLMEPAVDPETGEPSPVADRANRRRLERLMAKAGERYARRCKAEQSGYRPEDEYFYTQETVEAFLPVIVSGASDYSLLDTESLVSVRVNGGTPAHERGGADAILADLRRAYLALPIDHRALLASVFEPGQLRTDAEQVAADDLGVSRWAVRGRIDRAVRAMIRHAGGPSPYGGGRRAQSSARARAVLARQWEG